jgi:hypothetical protein
VLLPEFLCSVFRKISNTLNDKKRRLFFFREVWSAAAKKLGTSQFRETTLLAAPILSDTVLQAIVRVIQ